MFVLAKKIMQSPLLMVDIVGAFALLVAIIVLLSIYSGNTSDANEIAEKKKYKEIAFVLSILFVGIMLINGFSLLALSN